MSKPLSAEILLVENRPTDAELVIRELHRVGFAPEWELVETESAYRS